MDNVRPIVVPANCFWASGGYLVLAHVPYPLPVDLLRVFGAETGKIAEANIATFWFNLRTRLFENVR
jgi:hypothetical protein